jgi:hypothetical protein
MITQMVRFCGPFSGRQIIEAFEAFTGNEDFTHSFGRLDREVNSHARGVLLRRPKRYGWIDLSKKYLFVQLVGGDGSKNQLAVIATFMKAKLASLVPQESP